MADLATCDSSRLTLPHSWAWPCGKTKQAEGARARGGELREVVRPLPSSFLSAFLFRCSVIVLPAAGDPYADSRVATLVLSHRLAPAEPADPVRPGAWPLRDVQPPPWDQGA